MLRVAIVDDHELFRKSLILLLNSFENMTVISDAGDGSEFLKQLKVSNPDIVLIDIMMPGLNGYETCRILRATHPDIKIIVVSQLEHRDGIQKIIEAGANGFFSKKSKPEFLEAAIKSVYENDYYFSVKHVALLREHMTLYNSKTPQIKNPSVKFTAKELQILKMAALELNTIEIAEKLHINHRTVDSHRKKIMVKTGSRNFMGAIVFAMSNYYISLEN